MRRREGVWRGENVRKGKNKRVKGKDEDGRVVGAGKGGERLGGMDVLLLGGRKTSG